MIKKEESTKIANFMGSCARAWPYNSYTENALFLLNLLSGSQLRQAEYIVMMIYGGYTKYTKIVDFMSSGKGCLVIGRGH